MTADLIRVILAFALIGFMTWLWSQVNSYLIDNYLKPVLNTEMAVKGAIA